VARQFLSQEGALKEAQLRQTYLVNSVAHLFKASEDFNPTAATPLAEYTANECDFDGYVTKTLATWPNITSASGTSYLLYAAQQTWTWVFDTDAVGNMVGGMYIVSAAGLLIDVVVFDTPIAMQGALQAVVQTPSELIAN